MRTIHSLSESDLDALYKLLPMSHLSFLHVILHNGTETRVKTLPKGSTASYEKVSLHCDTWEQMKADLKHIDYNQIISCDFSFSKDGCYYHVSLSLLDRELKFSDTPSLFSSEKLLQFAREKELRKVSITF